MRRQMLAQRQFDSTQRWHELRCSYRASDFLNLFLIDLARCERQRKYRRTPRAASLNQHLSRLQTTVTGTSLSVSCQWSVKACLIGSVRRVNMIADNGVQSTNPKILIRFAKAALSSSRSPSKKEKLDSATRDERAISGTDCETNTSR